MTIGEDRSFVDQLMDLYLAGKGEAISTAVEIEMVRQLQAVFGAIARSDFGGLRDLMTEDFQMEILGPTELPIIGSTSGRDASIETIARNFSLLEDQRPQFIGVSVHRDAVLVMGRESGRVVKTRIEYTVHWVQWFTFRGDKLCRFLEIFDADQIGPAFLPPHRK